MTYDNIGLMIVDTEIRIPDNQNQVIIAKRLARRLATEVVPGSNPGNKNELIIQILYLTLEKVV